MYDYYDLIDKTPEADAQKPEMSETDRKASEKWCEYCDHIEMCKWYPFGGCEFRSLPKSKEQEKRHGLWKLFDKKKMPDGWTYRRYKCSECGFVGVGATNFCPWCGARMDGGGDHGEKK